MYVVFAMVMVQILNVKMEPLYAMLQNVLIQEAVMVAEAVKIMNVAKMKY